MIDDVEKQIYEVASKFAFVEKAETLLIFFMRLVKN